MKEFNEEEILKYVRSNKIYGTLGSEGMVYKVGDDAIKLLKTVKGAEFMASKEEKVDALIKNPIETLNLNRQCVQWVWECSEYSFNSIRFEL